MKKGVIIGLVSGLTIAGASFVFANSQIQAILNNQIKVTLNGITQTFRDETTNEIQYPITYMDRTYLPLRTVANLVGVDVDYDAKTKTAILNSNNLVLDGSEESIKSQLIGMKQWLPQYIVTERGEDVGLKEYYGSGVFTSNTGLIFKEDNTFTNFIGIHDDDVSDYVGTYKIDIKNNRIDLNYESGYDTIVEYSLTENNIVHSMIEDTSMLEKGNIRIGYEPKQKTQKNGENVVAYKKYTVNQVTTNSLGMTNEQCNITFENEKEFRMYLNFGKWLSGEYEVYGNLLTCHALIYEWDGGSGAGERKTNVKFTYTIESENRIKLLDIDIYDSEFSGHVLQDGFIKGMTYSNGKMYDADTYINVIEKYDIALSINLYNDGIQSNINICDKNSEVLLSSNIFYDEKTRTFDYSIDREKLLFSAYESFTPSETTDAGMTKLYRVYYEVVEENGTLKVNVLKEDKEDIKLTAAV